MYIYIHMCTYICMCVCALHSYVLCIPVCALRETLWLCTGHNLPFLGSPPLATAPWRLGEMAYQSQACNTNTAFLDEIVASLFLFVCQYLFP